MDIPYPSYRVLLEKGLFEERIENARRFFSPCILCPRRCRAKRSEGERGICRAADDIYVASHNLHFGEEPPISGYRGSGTIFFTWCNLRCVYCQNYPISQLGIGKKVSIEELARYMLDLQKRGAHNINLVTPTHYIFQIISAIYIAAKNGLTIPIVWNTSGYEVKDGLTLLSGIVDIYLTDIRYFDNSYAVKYSLAPNYKEYVIDAAKFMYKQVGDLILDDEGIAKRGLIIRHLILPNNISSTKEVLEFIYNEISPYTYISLMSQYFPAYKALEFPKIDRKITKEEFEEAVSYLKEIGLENGWIQEWEG